MEINEAKVSLTAAIATVLTALGYTTMNSVNTQRQEEKLVLIEYKVAQLEQKIKELEEERKATQKVILSCISEKKDTKR